MGIAAAMIATTALKVGTDYIAAKKEQQAWEHNAGITDSTISQIEAARKTQELRSINARQRLASSQMAAVASSGIEFKGSPVEVMNADIARSEFDLAVDNWNFENDKNRARNDANMMRYTGKQTQRAGLLRAAGSAVEGGTRAYAFRGK